MKKNLSKIIVGGLLACLAISFYPIRLQIKSYAQSYIKEESKKEYDYKLQYKDSVFRSINDPRSGKFACALYHNMSPRFESLEIKDKVEDFDDAFSQSVSKFNLDYLDKHGIKVGASTFFCNPNFDNLNLDYRSLIREITNINKSKGRDPYIPLEKGNYQGWFQSGWAIGVLHNRYRENSYNLFLVYPSVIVLSNGYRDTNMIRLALEQSYDYYTKNEDSDYTNCDKIGRFETFAQLCMPNNEGCYYRWVREREPNFHLVPQLSWEYLSNPFCKLWVGYSDDYHFELKLNENYYNSKTTQYAEELLKLHWIISLVIGIVLIICFIILLVVSHIDKKKQSVSFLERIIKASHPKHFIENYDKDKLEAANIIFDKASKTSENDKECIALLCTEVEEKLGISLLTKREIEKLRAKCNPKHFMKPYDAQKVSIANELYSRLNSNQISCGEYLEISSQIDKMMSNDSKAVEVASSETEVLAEEIQAPENENVEECTTDNDNHLEKPHKKNYSLVLYIFVAILVLFASLFAIPKSHLGMIIFMNLFGWAVIIGRYLHRKNKEEKA